MSTPSPIMVNNSLDLSCEIDRTGFNLVHPTVRWIGPDNKIYTGQTRENKYTLRLIRVSNNHNGNWICEVKYGAHELNAMSNVVIVGKYRINEKQLKPFFKQLHTFVL